MAEFLCSEDSSHVEKANVGHSDVMSLIPFIYNKVSIDSLMHMLSECRSSADYHNAAHFGLEILKDEIKSGNMNPFVEMVLFLIPDLVKRIEEKHELCRQGVQHG